MINVIHAEIVTFFLTLTHEGTRSVIFPSHSSRIDWRSFHDKSCLLKSRKDPHMAGFEECYVIERCQKTFIVRDALKDAHVYSRACLKYPQSCARGAF